MGISHHARDKVVHELVSDQFAHDRQGDVDETGITGRLDQSDTEADNGALTVQLPHRLGIDGYWRLWGFSPKMLVSQATP